MTHTHDHESLIHSLSREYGDLLTNSEQAMYAYFDDTHKVCNKKFATLLGYPSEAEWAKVDTSFPEAFVDDGSQETLVVAYRNAMERGIGSANTVVWKKKDGGTVKSSVILVPIVHDGHLFALHFVSA